MVVSVWTRSLLVGVILGFVDTLFTYLTGYAPTSDVVLILLPNLVLAFGVGSVMSRARCGQRWIDFSLVAAPIVLLGIRGVLAAEDFHGPPWRLAVRWGPTVVLTLIAWAVCGRQRNEDYVLSDRRFAFLAAALLLSAALCFGVRTDEFPAFDTKVVLIAVAMAATSAGLIGVSRAQPRGVLPSPHWAALSVGFFLLGSLSIAAGLGAVPPRLARVPPGGSPSGPQGQPNVLLIVLDTVRADHLSTYGYSRETSPRLTRFAQKAFRFDQAFANGTYSLPGHASLFSGLLASQHGAHLIPRPDLSLNLAVNHYALLDGTPTLANDLATRGYRTGGLSANDVFLAKWTGLQRGFQVFTAKARRRYHYVPLAAPLAVHMGALIGRTFVNFQDTWPANLITDAALEWIGTEDRPFFLFLNYFDAHGPYDVREGMRFTSDGRPQDAHGAAAYDSELAFLDQELGRLLETLEVRGILKNTMVVITSDHGEFFGEHGLAGHPSVLYDPILRIPLVVKVPGQREGQTVPGPFMQSDVRRMVHAVALEGRELTEILVDRAPLLVAEAWQRQSQPGSSNTQPTAVAIYDGTLKLIDRQPGVDELFDLATDPGESSSLFAVSGPIHGERLARMFGTHTRRQVRSDRQMPAMDQESVERLRALGYAQ